jgi:hypothetical protein
MRIFKMSLVAFLLFVGCKQMAVPPAGSYSEVLLVTEEGSAGSLNDLLTPLIAREHDYVLDREPAFKITAVKASDLEDFPVFKNVVICGVAESSTDVGQRIADLIGQQGIRRVSTEGANILKKENLPAPGQLTLVVTARNADELRGVISERGSELPDILEESCKERLRRHLLRRRNQTLSEDLHKRFGVGLEIPSIYRLFNDGGSPPGIELIREPPTRILGVFWHDWKSAPTAEDADPLFELRSEYVWKRYDSDKMDRGRVNFERAKLGPYDAIKMAGYWYNDKAVAGGYFETFYVFDEREQLLWAIDLLVYAPGRSKHPLFRELRALAETFRYD